MTLPILEPLSKATELQLEKLPLNDYEYLEIWMDTKDNYFNAKIVCRKSVPAPIPQDEVEEEVPSGFDQFLESLAEPEVDQDQIQKTYTGDWVAPTEKFIYHSVQQFFARIPEAKAMWLSDRQDAHRDHDVWRLGATDFTAIVIHSCWPKERLIFRSEDAQILYEYVLHRFYSQNARSHLAADFKINKTVPEDPADFTDHPDLPLADYQKVAMQFSLGHEATGLLMDRGTGKTAASIAKVCLEAKRTRAGRMGDPRMMYVLVVCPNQVRLNWQVEFERFATIPGKVTVIRGGQIKRIKLFTQAAKKEEDLAFSVVIVGYDTLPCDLNRLFLKLPWDSVILDESHWIKSPTTLRFKSLKQVREVSIRRQILTGSPIGNSYVDLWAQLEFLGEGLSGFINPKEFRKFYGKFSKREGSGGALEQFEGMQNLPLLQERLARLTFSITKKEAGLNLPDKLYDIHEVEMTTQQENYYNQIRDKLVLEIEQEMAAQEEQMVTFQSRKQRLTADHILTKLLRLEQVTSGFVKWDPVRNEDGEVLEPGVLEAIPGENPKIEAVVQMMKESLETDPNEKTVIWAMFTEDIRGIYNRLTEEGFVGGHYFGATTESDREKFVHQFNNEAEFRFLVCNAQSAGEGLNLIGRNPDRTDQETYCGHAIVFSQNWSAFLRGQKLDRSHRRGIIMPLRITDLMIPGTIDEEIRNRVTAKEEHANEVTDLSGTLERVLGMDLSSIGTGT